jgi:hypothetical protein
MSITAVALGILLFVCPPADPPPLRVVHVTVYNQAQMSVADIDRVFEVTNRVWAPYGVTLRRDAGPDAVAVVVSDRPVPTPDGYKPYVLGTTLFSQGHATPYISVSRWAAEAFAEGTSENGMSFNTRPMDQRNAIVARILGVALAHEVAHYLLDTAYHSPTGLLKAGLGIRELSFLEPWRLTLTPGQRSLLAVSCALDPRARDSRTSEDEETGRLERFCSAPPT